MTADFLKKTNLYLVGMMGAGKTTLGRKLASRLGYGFLDTDALIEKAAGKPISEIFEGEGEAVFRRLESNVLAEASAFTSLVVSTGGGIVTEPINWSYLRHGVVIWIDVPVPVLVSRLSDDTSRPLLKAVNLTARLEGLLRDRRDLYAQADICISYEGSSVGKTCDRIITTLQQSLRPDPRLEADKIVINQANINVPMENGLTEEDMSVEDV